MTINDITRLFDQYNREARLYPALIASAPVLWTIAVLAPQVFTDWPKGTVTVVLCGCLLYSAASLARHQGKRLEPKLLQLWGGWPTTTILRHRDSRIDSLTKRRYHSELERLCPGLKMPSCDEEAAFPEKADEVYRSATKRLIEARRGAKYQLLLSENASYGFRRNLLGLKSAAIAVARGEHVRRYRAIPIGDAVLGRHVVQRASQSGKAIVRCRFRARSLVYVCRYPTENRKAAVCSASCDRIRRGVVSHARRTSTGGLDDAQDPETQEGE